MIDSQLGSPIVAFFYYYYYYYYYYYFQMILLNIVVVKVYGSEGMWSGVNDALQVLGGIFQYIHLGYNLAIEDLSVLPTMSNFRPFLDFSQICQKFCM